MQNSVNNLPSNGIGTKGILTIILVQTWTGLLKSQKNDWPWVAEGGD